MLAVIVHHLHEFKIQKPVDGGSNTQQNWSCTTLKDVVKGVIDFKTALLALSIIITLYAL